jgi:hypothetical protein
VISPPVLRQINERIRNLAHDSWTNAMEGSMKTILAALAGLSLLATAPPATAQRGVYVGAAYHGGYYGGFYRGYVGHYYGPYYGGRYYWPYYRARYYGWPGYGWPYYGVGLGFAPGWGFGYPRYYGAPYYGYYPYYPYYSYYPYAGYPPGPYGYYAPPNAHATACGSWSWRPATSSYIWIPCGTVPPA